MLNINLPLMLVFSIYIAAIFYTGFIASKKINNMSDFILGGRNLSGAVAALGAGASDMSGWLLMALPGAAFVFGLNQIWLPIGLSIGAYLNWQFVAKRLRVYTEVANDSLTLPAYLDNRFHDHSKILRRVTGLVILIFFTFYAAAGFMAGAVLTQNIFHFDYTTSLLLSAAVIIVYTAIGGFLAISWVDFFQGSLMFFALLIVPAVAIYHLDGLHETFTLIANQGEDYLNAFKGITSLGIISLLAWGLGYFGQPHIIVRFMAVRTRHDIPLARFICMSWMIISLYGAIVTGMVGAAYFTQQKIPVSNPEAVFLMLAEALFNPWMAGILIAAVLSAIMSTVSAQLLSAASAITEDFYRDFFRPNASHRELILTARLSVLVIALIAIIIAAISVKNSNILGLVAYAWSGLGAAFGPVVLISLYWRRMTAKSAIAGIIVGAATVIVWEIFSHNFGGIFKLYSLLPGFMVNLLTIFLVGKLSAPPKPAIINDFDKTMKKIT